MLMFNPELMKMALWRLEQQQLKEASATTKSAFVPSPGAAGAPPDPSQGGGVGGGGGGDPAAMAAMAGGGGGGGMPAPPPGVDPAAGGAPPPGGLGAGTDIMAVIQQAVQTAVQQAMQGMGGAGGMAGGAGAAGGMGKPVKADINTVAMDIFQVKKLLTNIYQINSWPLPPDIIDGPNRDPASGAALPPGTPGSTSDPNNQAPPQAGGAGGGQSAIGPIEPMQGAFPPGQAPGGGGGGGEKTSSVLSHQGKPQVVGHEYEETARMVTKAAALASLVRGLRNRGVSSTTTSNGSRP